MVILALLRQKLVRWARRAGAPEPEDAAQDVLLKATRTGFEHTDSYWQVAARNTARTQQRKRKHASLGEDYDVAEPHESEITDRRTIPDSPAKTFLLGYYASKFTKTGAEKIRASRARAIIRKMLRRES